MISLSLTGLESSNIVHRRPFMTIESTPYLLLSVPVEGVVHLLSDATIFSKSDLTQVAILMFYFWSSLDIIVLFLSGLFVLGLSSIVLIFHVAMLRLYVYWTFLSWVTSCQNRYFSLLEVNRQGSFRMYKDLPVGCVPLCKGVELARMVQDEISILMATVTSQKYIVFISALTGCCIQIFDKGLSSLNSYIWPIDRTLKSTTTPGQSEPGSHGNKGILHILQSSGTGVAQSTGGTVEYTDCFSAEE